MTKHTPEPWNVEPLDGGYAVIDKRLDIVVAWCNPAGLLPGEALANANRIVACVNACRGMADPARQIKAMREVVEIAREASEVGGTIGLYGLRKLRAALKRLDGGGK